MNRSTVSSPVAVLLALVALATARAQPDAGPAAAPPALYTLSTEGTSVRVAAGAQGTFVLAVVPREGGHVSAETPLSVELTGQGLTLARARLTAADVAGRDGADGGVLGGAAGPRFEVPFTAAAVPGAGAVEARLVFYVCTGTVCARQQRALRVPVEVL